MFFLDHLEHPSKIFPILTILALLTNYAASKMKVACDLLPYWRETVLACHDGQTIDISSVTVSYAKRYCHEEDCKDSLNQHHHYYMYIVERCQGATLCILSTQVLLTEFAGKFSALCNNGGTNRNKAAVIYTCLTDEGMF